jgi:hypothetical protein
MPLSIYFRREPTTEPAARPDQPHKGEKLDLLLYVDSAGTRLKVRFPWYAREAKAKGWITLNPYRYRMIPAKPRTNAPAAQQTVLTMA